MPQEGLGILGQFYNSAYRWEAVLTQGDCYLRTITLSNSGTFNLCLNALISCRESRFLFLALTKWFSWLEHRPVHQKVAGLIPSQAVYLGCGFDLQSGCTLEATNLCFPSFSLSLFLCLNKQ